MAGLYLQFLFQKPYIAGAFVVFDDIFIQIPVMENADVLIHDPCQGIDGDDIAIDLFMDGVGKKNNPCDFA